MGAGDVLPDLRAKRDPFFPCANTTSRPPASCTLTWLASMISSSEASRNGWLAPLSRSPVRPVAGSQPTATAWFCTWVIVNDMVFNWRISFSMALVSCKRPLNSFSCATSGVPEAVEVAEVEAVVSVVFFELAGA